MILSQAIERLCPQAQWSLTGNDYATLEWRGPGNPPTLAELEAAWTALQSVKVWPSAQDFLRAFTVPELAAIWNSDDTLISALAMLIMAWPGAVHADHPEVVAGLNRLAELGILTFERRSQLTTV